MYRGTSSQEGEGSVARGLDEALDHMIAALAILDRSAVSAAIGARLEEAIEALRDEIGQTGEKR